MAAPRERKSPGGRGAHGPAPTKNSGKKGNSPQHFPTLQEIKKRGHSLRKTAERDICDQLEGLRLDRDSQAVGTGLVWDDRMTLPHCLWDDNFSECPARLLAVKEKLVQYGLVDRCVSIPAREATEEELQLVHNSDYVALMKSTQHMPQEELRLLSNLFDSVFLHPASFSASCLAVGSVLQLVDKVVKSEIRNGLAVVRPPGHHAHTDQMNGYCMFNQLAICGTISAATSWCEEGADRRLGRPPRSGTQFIFEHDPSVLYFSIHRYENGQFWPHLTGMSDADYITTFLHLLLPVAYEFQPQFVLVAAGFDSVVGDPKGEMAATPACFAHLTHLLMSLAEGRLLLSLEGGYNLRSLAEGVCSSLKILLGDPCPQFAQPFAPCESALDSISGAICTHRKYWRSLQEQDFTVKPIIKAHTQTKANGNDLQLDTSEDALTVTLDTVMKEVMRQIPKQRTGLVYDERMLAHYNMWDSGHPEAPKRIARIYQRHKDLGLLDRCLRLFPRMATKEDLRMCHSLPYIKKIESCGNMRPKDLHRMGDGYNSIYIHNKSFNCACLAAGSTFSAVEAVVTGKVQNGVCIVRPPGHHAEPGAACGFCFFNNVALAARYAQRLQSPSEPKLRVMILDWDIHHGNGTQHIFQEDDSVLYVSIHRYDNGLFFPTSEDAAHDQVGSGPGEGFNVNIPWNGGKMGDTEYLLAFHRIVMPIAYEFNPQLVLVSAGFDAARGDPLGGCLVTPEGYAHMTHLLMGLAGGRVVVVLEGGYNLTSISESMTMCTRMLLGEPPPFLSDLHPPRPSALRSIANVLSVHQKYWRSLRLKVEPAPSPPASGLSDVSQSPQLNEAASIGSLSPSMLSPPSFKENFIVTDSPSKIDLPASQATVDSLHLQTPNFEMQEEKTPSPVVFVTGSMDISNMDSSPVTLAAEASKNVSSLETNSPSKIGLPSSQVTDDCLHLQTPNFEMPEAKTPSPVVCMTGSMDISNIDSSPVTLVAEASKNVSSLETKDHVTEFPPQTNEAGSAKETSVNKDDECSPQTADTASTEEILVNKDDAFKIHVLQIDESTEGSPLKTKDHVTKLLPQTVEAASAEDILINKEYALKTHASDIDEGMESSSLKTKVNVTEFLPQIQEAASTEEISVKKDYALKIHDFHIEGMEGSSSKTKDHVTQFLPQTVEAASAEIISLTKTHASDKEEIMEGSLLGTKNQVTAFTPQKDEDGSSKETSFIKDNLFIMHPSDLEESLEGSSLGTMDQVTTLTPQTDDTVSAEAISFNKDHVFIRCPIDLATAEEKRLGTEDENGSQLSVHNCSSEGDTLEVVVKVQVLDKTPDKQMAGGEAKSDMEELPRDLRLQDEHTIASTCIIESGSHPAEDGSSLPAVENKVKGAEEDSCLGRNLPVVGSGLVWDDRMMLPYCLWDDKFPECPARLLAVKEKLEQYGLVDRCVSVPAREATEEELQLVHSSKYVELMKSTQRMTEEELESLSDGYDSVFLHPTSFSASCLAVGSVLQLVDKVMKAEIRNGLAVVRPPGHHAHTNQMNGYCMFNQLAIAARYLQRHHGVKRVLIVDWDVHHGQGTQFIFEHDPSVLYFSIHRYDNGQFWPFLVESSSSAVGKERGERYNMNVPWNKNGMNDADYITAFLHLLLPVAYEFQPQFVLVAAGFTSVVGDPEGEMAATPACFAHLTHLLMSLAEGRLLLSLEGGYNLRSLAEGVCASLKILLGDPCPQLAQPFAPCDSALDSISGTICIHRKYWRSLQEQDFTVKPMNKVVSPTEENCDALQSDTQKNAVTVTLDTVMKEVMRQIPKQRTGLVYDEQMMAHYDMWDSSYKRLLASEQKPVIAEGQSAPGWMGGKPCANKEFFEGNSLQPKNPLRDYFQKTMATSTSLVHLESLSEHPEAPQRIERIYQRHKELGLLNRCYRILSRLATQEELGMCHSIPYIEKIESSATMKPRDLYRTGEEYNSIYIHNQSYTCACLAAGSTFSVVEAVVTGKVQNGVCIVRPPGHHAESGEACGFCFFNNVALAARYAQRLQSPSEPRMRIMILDWDIHHGNGTQHMFQEDDSVLYVSIHRYDNGLFFPSSEDAAHDQVGSGPGEGFNVNIPWNGGKMGDTEYLLAFYRIIMPIAYEFNPQLVLVSAGFDAARGDPLGGCLVTPEGYAHMTHLLMGLAGGRVVVVLEGGYNLTSISESMTMCTRMLLGEPPPFLSALAAPQPSALQSISNVLSVHQKYWRSLRLKVEPDLSDLSQSPQPNEAAPFGSLPSTKVLPTTCRENITVTAPQIDVPAPLAAESTDGRVSHSVKEGMEDLSLGTKDHVTNFPAETDEAGSAQGRSINDDDAFIPHSSSAVVKTGELGEVCDSHLSVHNCSSEEDALELVIEVQVLDKTPNKQMAGGKTENDVEELLRGLKLQDDNKALASSYMDGGRDPSGDEGRFPSFKKNSEGAEGASQSLDAHLEENLLSEAAGGCSATTDLEALLGFSGELFAVTPLSWCPHLETVCELPSCGLDVRSPCAACGTDVENWVCLTCYVVLCGRYVSQHMISHRTSSRHHLVLSFSDLSVWCYSCDAYIHNEVLMLAKRSAYYSKFGEEMPGA